MKTSSDRPIESSIGSRVIRLNEFDEFPAYVAIYSIQNIENPFVLSPVAMQWSGQIVLNRLSDCETFWQVQKQKMGSDLNALFEAVLSQHYDEGFVAVFACHPWQCLLYLNYQLQQKSSGIYFLQSRLNRNVYQSLDWQVWFANQKTLGKHLEVINVKGFNAARFRARQAQLKRFISRIGLAGPFALKQADYQAFSRRFDTSLANIWYWTMSPAADLRGFPWITLKQPENPSRSRDLEYPVNQWPVVEVLLREDFLRLSELFVADDQEHINRMSWQVVLFNQQTVEVSLSFRHPYSLHRDAPEFKTALLQARYIYDDLIQELQARDKDLDLPETMPIIAWRIEVSERFSLPPMIWDLFGNDSVDVPRQALFHLQNKLPVAIESYCTVNSFYPEQSFRGMLLDEDLLGELDQTQWSSQSIHRPLFYYQSAQAIKKPEGNRFRFLERCASHWWQNNDCEMINRDYYQLQSEEGRASWVYRDGDGCWFKQGEYC